MIDPLFQKQYLQKIEHCLDNLTRSGDKEYDAYIDKLQTEVRSLVELCELGADPDLIMVYILSIAEQIDDVVRQ